MNPIEELKEEHELIEIELAEIENIIRVMEEENTINYSNFTHVFNNLHKVWNKHEEKEEKLFPALEKERIKIPVGKMQFEHRELSPHKNAINKAISSGSEFEMKKALEDNCRIVIEKLRKHIDDEDQILYTLAVEEYNPEELEQIWVKLKELQ